MTRDRDRRKELTACGALLDKLEDYAAAAGAPADWLESTIAELSAALLGPVDPRRERSLARGRRMKIARDSGASISMIAQEFGCSERTVTRLIGGVTRDVVLSPAYRRGRRKGGT